jgi:hypothetical protein
MEARNRAEIEARLGRPVAAGGVTPDDAIAMAQAGVSEEVIVNHVRRHGIVAPLQTNDLIRLQTGGVSPRVVQAMQDSTGPQVIVRGATPPPPQIIVEERIYPPYPPPPWRAYPYPRRHYRRW